MFWEAAYEPQLHILQRVAKIWADKMQLAHTLRDEFCAALVQFCQERDMDGFYPSSIQADEKPDMVLRQAAESSNFFGDFPVKFKTLWNMDYIAVRHNFAEWVYHYPLRDNKWLVTTLHGSEISKIIDHLQGKSLQLTID